MRRIFYHENFPQVWPIIFDKLESPIDKANCFRTCNLFRHLLEKERKTFLMPEVFKLQIHLTKHSAQNACTRAEI